MGGSMTSDGMMVRDMMVKAEGMMSGDKMGNGNLCVLFMNFKRMVNCTGLMFRKFVIR